MSKMVYSFKSPISQADLEDQLMEGGKYQNLQALKNLIDALVCGSGQAVVETAEDAVAASGTFTIASNSAQSVTIDGVTLTGGTAYAITSLTTTEIATNLAAAINASTDAHVQLVEASASGAVVTVTCKTPGLLGNLVEIAATGAATASDATLEGGAAGTPVVMAFNIAV